MTDDEIIAVVQAHKDGKTIQYYDGSDWKNRTDITEWDFLRWVYRVKPESREPREWWIDELSEVGFDIASRAPGYDPRKRIHVIEVIE